MYNNWVKRVLKRVQSPESRHSSKQAAVAAAAGQQDSGGQITKALSPKCLHKYQTSKANWDQVFGGLEKLTNWFNASFPLHGSNHAHLRICCQRFGAKVFLHWVAGKMRNHDTLLSFRHRLPRPKPWISWRPRKSTRLQAYKLTSLTTPLLIQGLSTLLILREGWVGTPITWIWFHP